MTPSDYEPIVFDLASLHEMVGSMGTSQEATWWVIKSMSEEETKEVQRTWQECTASRVIVGDSGITDEMKEKAAWMERSLTVDLNSHATPLIVTVQSKRWWTPEMAAKCKKYG